MSNIADNFVKLFNPKTDIFALLIVVGGLFIAIFLEGLAIKLIGVCLIILSSVTLFSMYSQRLATIPPEPKFNARTAQQSTYSTKVDTKTNKKKLVFDDTSDFSSSSPATPEQISPAPSAPTPPPVKTESSPVSENNIVGIAASAEDSDDENFSGFRIVSKKKNKEDKPADEPKSPANKETSLPSKMEKEPSISKETPVSTPTESPKATIAAPETASDEPMAVSSTPPKNIPLAAATTGPQAEYVLKPEEQEEYREEFEEEEAVSHRRKHFTIQMSEFAHEVTDSVKNEPRKEFDFLLQRVLSVIRTVMPARTAAFFWIDFDAERLLLELRLSDAEDCFQESRSIPLADDIVSQIATTGLPQILTDIHHEAECELLPYYHSCAGTRSFIGVPVYYDGMVVGVLLADDPQDDAYDEITVSFLGNFTKLIGGLIQSYTEKYDLLHSARALQALNSFRAMPPAAGRDRHKVSSALLDALEPLVPYTSLGVITFNEEAEQWEVSAFKSKIKGNMLLHKEVDLHSCFAGKAVLEGTTVRFTELPSEGVRVSEEEATFRDCEFLVLPIQSLSRTHGAFFLETQRPNSLTQQDIAIFELLVELAGNYFENIHTDMMLASHTLVDEATAIANAGAFEERAVQEFDRAVEMRNKLTLCILNLDSFASPQFNSDGLFRHHALMHVVAIVQKNLRRFDAIGRLHENTLGILLIEKDAREAQMWAERVRREIAGSLFSHQKKQFAVTVNIGIAEINRHNSFDELAESAYQVAEQAKKKTNAVIIFG